jgi:hypothetical protein
MAQIVKHFYWIGLVIFAVTGFFLFYVRPKMAAIHVITGKQDELIHCTGCRWLAIKFDGWKTHILALIAGMAQLVNYIDETAVTSLGTVPWGNVFDTHVANLITTVCLFLIPVTHMYGLAKAARTEPHTEGN